MNKIGVVAQEQPYYSSLPKKSLKARKRKNGRAKSLPRHERLVLTGLVLLVFIVGISVMYFYAQMVMAGYQVNKVKQEINDLDIQTRDLSENLAQLSSLERVEEVATTKLGMIKPDTSQMILVKTDPSQAVPPGAETSGQPGEAAGSNTGEGSNWIIKALVNLVQGRGATGAG